MLNYQMVNYWRVCIVIITYSGEYSLMIIGTYIDNVPFFWMEMGRGSDRVYIYIYAFGNCLDNITIHYSYLKPADLPIIYKYWLVVSTPLKNIFVSWDDDIPNI